MEITYTIRGRRRRRRGRLRNTIRVAIKKDLEFNNLNKSMILNKTYKQKLIHVVDLI